VNGLNVYLAARRAVSCVGHDAVVGAAGPDAAGATAKVGGDLDCRGGTLRPGRRLGWEIEQLADELTDLFGHKVDLVSLRALHPLLQHSVLAETRPVYAA
jgi:hypothetical protein